MSRLLWFVLGGVVTAVGAGIASVMLDAESEGGQEAIESQDDTAFPEQSA